MSYENNGSLNEIAESVDIYIPNKGQKDHVWLALCTMFVKNLMCSASLLESKENIKSKFLTYRVHGAKWFATQVSIYWGFYIL